MSREGGSACDSEGGGAIYDGNPVIMRICVGTYATDAALGLYLLCETDSFQDFCGNIFSPSSFNDGKHFEVILLTPSVVSFIQNTMIMSHIFAPECHTAVFANTEQSSANGGLGAGVT